MNNPADNFLFWGFDNYEKYISQEACMQIYDQLYTLFQYLGIFRMQNPESNEYCCLDYDLEYGIDMLARYMKLDLKFPNPLKGEYGIVSKRGIICYRAVQAIYQALLIRHHLQGNLNGKVLEIGAGSGRTAYFAKQLGIKNYTIIDLPMTIVAQSDWLGRVIGEEGIVMWGEQECDSAVNLVPCDMLDELEGSFDIIINVDSFTELNESTQEKYWSYIKDHSSTFISINHEYNQHTVKDYYERDNVFADRKLYPLRKGYLEEIVRFR